MKAPLETSLAYKYFVAYRLYDGQRFDEVVIPYKPKNSYQKKVRRLLHGGAKIHIALITFCLLLAAFMHAAPVPFLALVLGAAAWWGWVETQTSMQPTHFGMSKKGLRQYWIRWFGDKSSSYVPWNQISNVRLRHNKEAGLIRETWVDFVSAKEPEKCVFSLRLDGVVTGEQRKRLHTAIRQHLDDDQIDRQLHDILNPVKVDSYTQLWLEVLATSPQRNRIEALPVNAHIANNRYEILKQIGHGGQGVAYLARARAGAFAANSEPLDVVLKEFVLPYHAGLSVSKKALENIQREAELLKQLQHPRIVRMIDIFVEDQRAYMVLEHIPGESLREIVDRGGPYAEEQTIDLAVQMCEILSHLHAQHPPVLHRDFTPENLIMSIDGLLKLIDFNVAQVMHSDATRTVVGKHSYIPPEQFRGKATTQSDIYALGASLFFLLTGKEPEPISTAHPRNIRDSISEQLDAIIAKATAIDVETRYASADQLKADLLQLQQKMQRTGS